MIKLPNDKICYNLPEQVAANAENVRYLAETYKNLDEQVATWPEYKAEWDQFAIDYANWTATLEDYLTNMSSAAVSAIAGQNIAPANVAATGNITSPSIIETMTGYSFDKSIVDSEVSLVYVGACKNGNKLSFVVFGTCNFTALGSTKSLGRFNIPQEINDKIFPFTLNGVDLIDIKHVDCFKTQYASDNASIRMTKGSGANPPLYVFMDASSGLSTSTTYVFRFEATFLLSDNLAV